MHRIELNKKVDMALSGRASERALLLFTKARIAQKPVSESGQYFRMCNRFDNDDASIIKNCSFPYLWAVLRTVGARRRIHTRKSNIASGLEPFSKSDNYCDERGNILIISGQSFSMTANRA